MSQKGHKTKNKFAHPPYLPEFKKEDAQRLRKILHIISRTCCKFKIPEGVIIDIDDLLERPSRIRECDLYTLKPVVDAINMVAEIEDDVVAFVRDVLGIKLLPHQEEFLRKSRGELRLLIRGTGKEAMSAFEELMRRNMEGS